MKYLLSPILFLLGVVSLPLSAATSAGFAQTPPGLLQNNAPPVVMLTMPKDHQLFFKAYSDFEDITGDGIPETSYVPTLEYIGYFDNKLCYKYDTTNNWFAPKEEAKTKDGGTALYCNQGTDKELWSGNFLNWASMTRIDILRQVFYGGKRVTPQPSAVLDGVLLERSHIPGDAHSFAKYYAEADLPDLTPYKTNDDSLSCESKDLIPCRLVRKGITLCNSTRNSTDSSLDDGALSQNTINPPLIRVARGNFSLWSASERLQCKYWDSPDFLGMGLDWGGTKATGAKPGNSSTVDENNFNNSLNDLMTSIFETIPTKNFYFYHDSPTTKFDNKYAGYYEPSNSKGTQKLDDLQARVVACSSAFPSGTNECKKYPAGLKPVGLLQNQDFSNINWGLMSGSFSHNKDGGALRKNVAQISDEIDSNGNFIAPEAGGLIAFLDNLRIVNWGYNAGNTGNDSKSSYVGWGGNNCGTPDISFGRKATFFNGECVSWGNPLSAILMDAYDYLAGKKAPLQSSIKDGDYFSNATPAGAARKNAMTSQDWSSNPLAVAPTVNSNLKACSKLNVIAINGSTVSYDGEADFTKGALTTFRANTKTIGEKEDLYNGTKYFIADYVGKPPSTTGTPVCLPSTLDDLSKVRGTCPDAPALSGSYLMAGMAYEANITKNINPFYGKGIRTSAISLSMGVPQIKIPTNTNTVIVLPACRNKSKIGADFMGSCALVDFKILSRNSNGSQGSALVIWEDAQQGSDFDQDVTQLIDYSLTSEGKVLITTKILSQSTKDELELGYTITGVQADQEGYQGLLHINTGSSGTDSLKDPTTYTPGMTTNATLESPLYYAAKWGGFNDLDGDNTISSTEEWNKYNNKTQTEGTGDTLPDNYSVVVNPKSLPEDLKRFLKESSPAVFSYAAVGSINTLDDGSGFNLSTLFRQTAQSKTGSVSWVGSLTAYARGSEGSLHEDTNKDGKLNDGDNIITFVTDTPKGTPETNAKFYPYDEPPTSTSIPLRTQSIGDLNFSTPYWSAERNLAQVANYSIQADYKKDKRSDKRYIFTALGNEGDTLIAGDSTVVPFDTANGFPATGVNATRTRWFDYGTGDTSNLVNFIRGKEIAAYRSRRIDFVDKYSNDADDIDGTNATDNNEPWLLGDIVNSSPLAVGPPKAGYDRDYGDDTYATFREKFKNRRHVVYVGANDGMLHAFNLGKYDAATNQYQAETNFPLGAELWAYVPFNVLPHLKWLTEKNYSHNFYVDGRVKNYDVNIFPDSSAHPGGWGTILVVTMRTGGGAYDIKRTDASGNDTLRSAIIVMDVTDPENPPKLIAEIPMPDNTFTTVNPDIVKFRKQATDGSYSLNNWYLALASGVTDSKNFTSDKTPSLFMFDLINKNWVSASGGATGIPISSNKGWVGGINSRDWDGDYQDDYLYFGTVEGSVAVPAGSLYRASVNSDGKLGTPASVLDVTDKAFAATPFTVVDKKGKYWVFAGTGRYFSDNDNLYTSNQNSYFAIKEVVTGDALTTETKKANLLNLTGVTVNTSDDLNKSLTYNTTTISNRNGLESAVDQASGWYFDFDSANSRNYTSTILVNSALVFNTYEPGDGCSPYGSSRQYQRDFFSGIPRARVNNSGSIAVLPAFRDLGAGAASDPTPGKKTATGTSLGGIDIDQPEGLAPPSARQSWRELPFSQ